MGGFLDERATETEPEQIQERLDAVDQFLADNEGFFKNPKDQVIRVHQTRNA